MNMIVTDEVREPQGWHVTTQSTAEWEDAAGRVSESSPASQRTHEPPKTNTATLSYSTGSDTSPDAQTTWKTASAQSTSGSSPTTAPGTEKWNSTSLTPDQSSPMTSFLHKFLRFWTDTPGYITAGSVGFVLVLIIITVILCQKRRKARNRGGTVAVKSAMYADITKESWNQCDAAMMETTPDILVQPSTDGVTASTQPEVVAGISHEKRLSDRFSQSIFEFETSGGLHRTSSFNSALPLSQRGSKASVMRSGSLHVADRLCRDKSASSVFRHGSFSTRLEVPRVRKPSHSCDDLLDDERYLSLRHTFMEEHQHCDARSTSGINYLYSLPNKRKGVTYDTNDEDEALPQPPEPDEDIYEVMTGTMTRGRKQVTELVPAAEAQNDDGPKATEDVYSNKTEMGTWPRPGPATVGRSNSTVPARPPRTMPVRRADTSICSPRIAIIDQEDTDDNEEIYSVATVGKRISLDYNLSDEPKAVVRFASANIIYSTVPFNFEAWADKFCVSTATRKVLREQELTSRDVLQSFGENFDKESVGLNITIGQRCILRKALAQLANM